MTAGVRLTIRRRPSVSTAMWRLRPTIFLPASYPLVFASGALTDWLSTTPPVGLASRPTLSVEHQRDIVDRLKHEPTDKSAKPPIDRLPRREIIRQHPPSPARTGHVADRVQHLPQIDLDRPSAFDARGRKGSIRAHSSSVKSLGYRLAFFSILAIRPRVAGVHIPSLNHRRKPHSTTFQTVS